VRTLPSRPAPPPVRVLVRYGLVLLAGVAGGWLAGLLEVPKEPAA